jgi:hypothetical protein
MVQMRSALFAGDETAAQLLSDVLIYLLKLTERGASFIYEASNRSSYLSSRLATSILPVIRESIGRPKGLNKYGGSFGPFSNEFQHSRTRCPLVGISSSRSGIASGQDMSGPRSKAVLTVARHHRQWRARAPGTN